MLTAKIFVYNGKGAGPNSVADTVTLFQEWFPQSDTKASDFTSNCSGLDWRNQSIFAVPGGWTLELAVSLNRTMPKVIADTQKRFHSFNICAGASLIGQAEFFKTNYNFGETGFLPPQYIGSSDAFKYKPSLSSTITALGSFYPQSDYVLKIDSGKLNATQRDFEKAKFRPQPALISFGGTDHATLYVEGCGFDVSASDSSIVGLHPYMDSRPYSFQYPSKTISYGASAPKPLFATVTRNADIGNNIGGVVATGIHPEASVSNSRLLQFFKTPNAVTPIALLDSDHDAIRNSADNISKEFKSLVERTFSLK